MLVDMSSLPPSSVSRSGDFAMRARPHVRAIVFADTGGREVLRLEQRPDPVPGSEAAEAFDYMAGSGKFGKVLLAF